MKYGNGYPREELCARSELVSRLEAKQLVGARGDALAHRIAGRCDKNSYRYDSPESRWRDAVPPVAPPIRRDSLRTALLFLTDPATQNQRWAGEGVVMGVKHAFSRAPNGQKRG